MSSIVQAASDSAFYDFEDYTKAHEAPGGWTAGNAWNASPYKVDDAHGTSLKLQDGTVLNYVLPEPVSSGKFLIGFEVNFADKTNVMRTHLHSPKGNSDAYSIYMFNRSVIKAADTSAGAWNFGTTIKECDTDTWYQFDMLFDMDEKKLTYYIDGVQTETVKIAFSDFDKLIFRTGESNEKGVMYIDNASFKYISPGSFDTDYTKKNAAPGDDEITLKFTDAMDKTTLSDIRVYSLGDDLLSYSPEEIKSQITDMGVKSVTLKLDEPFKAGNAYKIAVNGAKTVFGEGLTNENTYFSAGGGLVETGILNADFSTVEKTGMSAPIAPAGDKEWIKEKRVQAVQAYHDAELDKNIVRFVKNKGTKDFVKNETALLREFDTPYDGFKIFEYRLKSVTGNQSFSIIDSDGNTYAPITITNDGIYNGGTKLSDYTRGEWFTIRIEADFDNKTAAVKKDGETIAENIDISAVKNAAKAEFSQENIADTFNDTSITEYAESYLAYFKIYAMKEGIAPSMITFEDKDRNVIYPDGKIAPEAIRMNIRFSDAVDAATLGDGVLLKKNGEKVGYSASYNEENNTYTLEFDRYLSGNAEYTFEITNALKDLYGNGVSVYNGGFSTAAGRVKAENLSVSDADGSFIVSADIEHTDGSCPTMYLIYTAYKGNLMIDMQYRKIETSEEDRKISVVDVYHYPEGTTRLSGFLWDGFDTMIPMIKMQSAGGEK